MDIPTIKLNGDVFMPALGLGTWQITGEACRRAVITAIELGYRHIDTASTYGNQIHIGQAVKECGIPREEIFITSKIDHSMLARRDVFADMNKIIDELKTDYIDLLLIHWPNKSVPISETLLAMNDIKKGGQIKALGVSNFTVSHIEEALDSGIGITNNQIEFHPSLNQEELLDYCQARGISVTAYSPLARTQDLELEVIQELAQKHNRSAPQVILNWLMQKGIAAIPASKDLDHQKENLKTLEWRLEQEDINKIDSIPQQERVVNPGFAEF